MNWGTKIVLGLGLFMAFIITLVVLMVNSNSDDLVDSDYYEKGIEYDKDYVRKNQVLIDKAEPVISVNEDLKIVFKSPISGTIHFIHPSDQSKDRSMPLNSGSENEIKIPLDSFTKGHWKVILEWESSGKSYLYDKSIIIN